MRSGRTHPEDDDGEREHRAHHVEGRAVELLADQERRQVHRGQGEDERPPAHLSGRARAGEVRSAERGWCRGRWRATHVERQDAFPPADPQAAARDEHEPDLRGRSAVESASEHELPKEGRPRPTPRAQRRIAVEGGKRSGQRAQDLARKGPRATHLRRRRRPTAPTRPWPCLRGRPRRRRRRRAAGTGGSRRPRA